MAYVCGNCGELDNFTQIKYITEYSKEMAFITGETENEDDWEHLDTYDSETTDRESIECQKCCSGDINSISMEEWNKLKMGIDTRSWKEIVMGESK